VAISPIVGDKPVSGPAGKFMQAKGFEVSASGVYNCYKDFLDVLVIDKSDRCEIEAEAEAKGVEVLKTDIIIRNDEDSRQLGLFLLDYLRMEL